MFKNTAITKFNELRYFTGIASSNSPYAQQFSGCTSLTELWVAVIGANGYTGLNYTFQNLTALTTLNLSCRLRIGGVDGFSGTTLLKRVNLSSLSVWYDSDFSVVPGRPAHASGEIHLYLIGSDEEITTIDHPSTTSVKVGQFYGCRGLTSVNIPSSVTSIGESAFQKCSRLTSIPLSDSLTYIGPSAFNGCSLLTGSVILPNCSVGINAFNGCPLTNLTIKTTNMISIAGAGDSTGTAIIIGNVTTGLHNANNTTTRFPHIVIKGNATLSTNQLLNNSGSVKSIRISGNWSYTGGNGLTYTTASNFEFFELGGVVGDAKPLFNSTNGPKSGGIIHFGYSDIAVPVSNFASSEANRNTIINRLSKIYVGDGMSEIYDQAILNKYLADESWATYSSKLDIWSNYNGEYKKNPMLPSDYTELEYVGTDSQARIDTGISGDNNNLEIKASLKWTTFAAYGGMFGNYVNESTPCWRAILQGSNNGKLYACANTTTSGSREPSASFGDTHRFDFKAGEMSVDTDTRTTGITSGNTANICLGAASMTSSAVDIGLQIKSFTILDNGTKVIDLIPCKRNADNVAGFWDTVSRTFKTSDTETPFTAGPVLYEEE